MSVSYKHWCTLTPETEEDRRKFWDFRVEDIAEMFSYYAVAAVIFWVIQLTLYILSAPDERSAVMPSVLLESLSLVLTSMVWVMLKSRFKKQVVTLLISLSVVNVLIHSLNFDSLMKKQPDGSSLEAATHIVRFRIFLYCILLAPSLAVVIAY